ncbi:hypothetical protein BIW11_12817, partial [Tropilaelaps mercedesae]
MQSKDQVVKTVQQPPIIIPARPEVERGIPLNNENDNVGVIVELPQKSMNETLPVIITFFIILTCLVPIDIFLALHILNHARTTRSTPMKMYARSTSVLKAQQELHILRLSADFPNSIMPVTPDNWCGYEIVTINPNVYAIKYDIGLLKNLSHAPFTRTVVYMLKMTINVPADSIRRNPVKNGFVLAALDPPEVYQFDLSDLLASSKKLKGGTDSSKFTVNLLHENGFVQLNRFDVTETDGYVSYRVSLAIDLSLNRLRVESCRRPGDCTMHFLKE